MASGRDTPIMATGLACAALPRFVPWLAARMPVQQKPATTAAGRPNDATNYFRIGLAFGIVDAIIGVKQDASKSPR